MFRLISVVIGCSFFFDMFLNCFKLFELVELVSCSSSCLRLFSFFSCCLVLFEFVSFGLFWVFASLYMPFKLVTCVLDPFRLLSVVSFCFLFVRPLTSPELFYVAHVLVWFQLH